MKNVYWVAGPLVIALSCYLLWEYLAVPAGPVTAKVKGTVTLDGSAVARGTIQFVPDRKVGPASTLEIKDGKFEGKAFPGVSSIVISSLGDKTKKVEIKPADPEKGSPAIFLEEPEEVIPERFNKMTGLQREVKAGMNEFDFDLKTPADLTAKKE